MRSIIDSLGVKPARPGSRRILIIDDADALNPESANCFLKTLEEPPPDSLLILLGTAAERQLDTIRSRCQVLVFRSLNKDDFAKAAVDAGLVASAAEALALSPMAQGSLSLVEALKDPEMQRITGELAKALQSPKFASVAFGILLVKFCEGVKEAALKRQRARFAVSYLVQLFRAALVQAETGQTGQHPQQAAVNRLAGLANISAVPALIEACLETEHHIDRRFQLAMLLEAFADRLGKIL
jgi:DNA polymerase-3 subunit delta'